LSWPHLKMTWSSTNTFAVNWKALKHLEIHNNKIKNLAFRSKLDRMSFNGCIEI
jgi:hypothetical protein